MNESLREQIRKEKLRLRNLNARTDAPTPLMQALVVPAVISPTKEGAPKERLVVVRAPEALSPAPTATAATNVNQTGGLIIPITPGNIEATPAIPPLLVESVEETCLQVGCGEPMAGTLPEDLHKAYLDLLKDRVMAAFAAYKDRIRDVIVGRGHGESAYLVFRTSQGAKEAMAAMRNQGDRPLYAAGLQTQMKLVEESAIPQTEAAAAARLPPEEPPRVAPPPTGGGPMPSPLEVEACRQRFQELVASLPKKKQIIIATVAPHEVPGAGVIHTRQQTSQPLPRHSMELELAALYDDA